MPERVCNHMWHQHYVCWCSGDTGAAFMPPDAKQAGLLRWIYNLFRKWNISQMTDMPPCFGFALLPPEQRKKVCRCLSKIPGGNIRDDAVFPHQQPHVVLCREKDTRMEAGATSAVNIGLVLNRFSWHHYTMMSCGWNQDSRSHREHTEHILYRANSINNTPHFFPGAPRPSAASGGIILLWYRS